MIKPEELNLVSSDDGEGRPIASPQQPVAHMDLGKSGLT